MPVKLRHAQCRRAAVAVQVAITLPVLVGFAAITIDVGTMYNTRTDMQRTADAAALAAIAVVANAGEDENPLPTAIATASEYVARNHVMGRELAIDSTEDVIFGRANYDAYANTYNFTPGGLPTNAVRVIVRHTEDSPNGQAPLYFAHIFGKAATNISAQAVAMFVDTHYEDADCHDVVPEGSVMLCHYEGDSDDSDDSASGDSDDSDDSDSGDSDGSHNGDSDDSDDSESGDSDDSDDSGAGADSGSGGADSADSGADSGADSDAPHTIIADAEATPIFIAQGDTMGPCGDCPDDDSGDGGIAGADSDGGVAKVTLCHIPPGNPDNAHTITIGEPAVAAHIEHGDTLGSCPGDGTLRIFLIE